MFDSVYIPAKFIEDYDLRCPDCKLLLDVGVTHKSFMNSDYREFQTKDLENLMMSYALFDTPDGKWYLSPDDGGPGPGDLIRRRPLHQYIEIHDCCRDCIKIGSGNYRHGWITLELKFTDGFLEQVTDLNGECPVLTPKSAQSKI